jgi:hypothetical protein
MYANVSHIKSMKIINTYIVLMDGDVTYVVQFLDEMGCFHVEIKRNECFL